VRPKGGRDIKRNHGKMYLESINGKKSLKKCVGKGKTAGHRNEKGTFGGEKQGSPEGGTAASNERVQRGDLHSGLRRRERRNTKKVGYGKISYWGEDGKQCPVYFLYGILFEQKWYLAWVPCPGPLRQHDRSGRNDHHRCTDNNAGRSRPPTPRAKHRKLRRKK